jgi:hypothetical protein
MMKSALQAEGGAIGRPAFRYAIGVEQNAVAGLQPFRVERNGDLSVIRPLARAGVDVTEAKRRAGLAGELLHGPAPDQQRWRVAAGDPGEQPGGQIQVAQQRGHEPLLAEGAGDGVVGARRDGRQ